MGFRSPYLNTDAGVRRALHEGGFLYESSLVEDPRQSLSRGFDDRVWPWDLGFGIPINCSVCAFGVSAGGASRVREPRHAAACMVVAARSLATR